MLSMNDITSNWGFYGSNEELGKMRQYLERLGFRATI